jgi:MinD-like ATPase involved in chromosome partitioning or flagellar assembly
LKFEQEPDVSKAKLTPQQFAELRPTLVQRLTQELERELEDCQLADLGKDPSTDLWSPPKVDSKTVVKLSPTVSDLTGWRLKPDWIQKGGYPTVAEAVAHVVAQVQKNCVAEPAAAKPNVKPAAVELHH